MAIHRETSEAVLGVKDGFKLEELREWVKGKIHVGERFKAPRDAYNTIRDTQKTNLFVDKMVVRFYDYYVLTIDEFGKTETYQYYDVYELLRGQGK